METDDESFKLIMCVWGGGGGWGGLDEIVHPGSGLLTGSVPACVY